LFPTDSWIDPEGATVNVREKELAGFKKQFWKENKNQ
jgi:hypothetical protein